MKNILYFVVLVGFLFVFGGCGDNTDNTYYDLSSMGEWKREINPDFTDKINSFINSKDRLEYNNLKLDIPVVFLIFKSDFLKPDFLREMQIEVLKFAEKIKTKKEMFNINVSRVSVKVADSFFNIGIDYTTKDGVPNFRAIGRSGLENTIDIADVDSVITDMLAKNLKKNLKANFLK
jgi:hypothetical protein